MKSTFTINFGFRIFAAYFLLTGIALYWGFNLVSTEIKPTIRQATEETLVDTANLLAEFATPLLTQDTTNQLARDKFSGALTRFSERRYNATIFGVSKTRSYTSLYVTDASGIVVYDSRGLAQGEDYSRWNDVYLTLRGQYGARSTKDNPADESSSVMYVAAPVKQDGKIIGVLTLAKSNASVQPFINLVGERLATAGTALLVGALLVGGLLSYMLTGSIRRLANYAEALKNSEEAEPPHMNDRELVSLADSIQSLRQALRGKEYVEEYLLTLSHEMKSPMSAIIGAAELIDADMPEQDLKKFIDNIQGEAHRLSDLVTRMLEVARIEHLVALPETAEIDLHALALQCAERAQQANPGARVIVEPVAQSSQVIGDAFLLQQAIENVLTNALEFSPPTSPVTVAITNHDQNVTLTVTDSGPGIPDYALDRVYNRFYSLPRPQTGKRGTGLGLTFVKRVLELHGGRVDFRNLPDKGFVMQFTFPKIDTSSTP